jgi:hypothetical protein
MMKILGIFLSLILSLQSSQVYAIAETVEAFEKGYTGVSRPIARPISRLVLKKMGTPGFFISKYMSYRRVMNEPICTPSEKFSFTGSMLGLIGDVTYQIMDLVHKRELKNEFKENSEKIKDYLKNNPNPLKSSTTNTDQSSDQSSDQADVQLMAFDYLIKENDLELERLKIVRTFKLSSLAMHLTSNILNAKEALGEASSAGSYTAEVSACKEKHRAAKEAKEKKLRERWGKDGKETGANAGEAAPKSRNQIAQERIDKAPPYLKPFVWLAEKINIGRKRMDSKNQANIADYGGIGALESANYAEEMMTGILFNEKLLGKAIKNDVAQDLAMVGVRLGVRAAVKANIEVVDKFMRSAAGRYTVYGYNIFVLYTEFQNMQNQIHNAKTKKMALEEARGKLFSSPKTESNETVLRPQTIQLIDQVLQFLIPTVYASSPNYINNEIISDLKICTNAECTPFIDNDFKNLVQKSDKNVQKSIIEIIKKSPTARLVHKVNSKQGDFLELDHQQALNEINQLEMELQHYHDQLNKKGVIKPNHLEQVEEIEASRLEQWVKPLIGDEAFTRMISSEQIQRVDKSDIKIDASNIDDEAHDTPSEQNASTVHLVAAANTFTPAASSPQVIPISEESIDDFSLNTIAPDSTSIWDILSYRYRKKFQNE